MNSRDCGFCMDPPELILLLSNSITMALLLPLFFARDENHGSSKKKKEEKNWDKKKQAREFATMFVCAFFSLLSETLASGCHATQVMNFHFIGLLNLSARYRGK